MSERNKMTKEDLAQNMVILAADLGIMDELKSTIYTKEILEQEAKKEDPKYVPQYDGVDAFEKLVTELNWLGYFNNSLYDDIGEATQKWFV